jgi:hypothetical protein
LGVARCGYATITELVCTRDELTENRDSRRISIKRHPKLLEPELSARAERRQRTGVGQPDEIGPIFALKDGLRAISYNVKPRGSPEVGGSSRVTTGLLRFPSV